jgi:hypothetical protein
VQSQNRDKDTDESFIGNLKKRKNIYIYASILIAANDRKNV